MSFPIVFDTINAPFWGVGLRIEAWACGHRK